MIWPNFRFNLLSELLQCIIYLQSQSKVILDLNLTHLLILITRYLVELHYICCRLRKRIFLERDNRCGQSRIQLTLLFPWFVSHLTSELRHGLGLWKIKTLLKSANIKSSTSELPSRLKKLKSKIRLHQNKEQTADKINTIRLCWKSYIQGDSNYLDC